MHTMSNWSREARNCSEFVHVREYNTAEAEDHSPVSLPVPITVLQPGAFVAGCSYLTIVFALVEAPGTCKERYRRYELRSILYLLNLSTEGWGKGPTPLGSSCLQPSRRQERTERSESTTAQLSSFPRLRYQVTLQSRRCWWRSSVFVDVPTLLW